MQKKLILCIVLAIFAIGTIYALYLLSRVPSNLSNHFIRKLPPHILAEKGGLAWQNNPWRLAGNDDSAFYLAHRGLLNVVMRLKKKNFDTSVVSIQLAGNINPGFNSAAWLSVDSGAFYLADGKKGELYSGSTATWRAQQTDNHTPFFDKAVILNNNIYFRGINTGREFALGKRNILTRQQSFFPDLLEKQVDGMFDEDGFLLKDISDSRIIYLYRYRNRFIVMDTAMKLLYKGKTIDTVSHVQLKLGTVDNGAAIKMANPPPTVNSYACTANGRLFVKSTLRADNELAETTKNASVVDVYDLSKGDYHFSFYVPDRNRERMSQFLISGRLLIALYPHQLKIYEITLP